MPRIKTYEASKKRFDAIKTLSENGVPKTQIAKILGLASSSVWRMLQHETYDDYLEHERKAFQDRREEKVSKTVDSPKELSIEETVLKMMEQSNEALQEINEIFKIIGQRLDRLENKKRFF